MLIETPKITEVSFSDKGQVGVADLEEREVCLKKSDGSKESISWDAWLSSKYDSFGSPERRLAMVLGQRNKSAPSWAGTALIGRSLETYLKGSLSSYQKRVRAAYDKERADVVPGQSRFTAALRASNLSVDELQQAHLSGECYSESAQYQFVIETLDDFIENNPSWTRQNIVDFNKSMGNDLSGRFQPRNALRFSQPTYVRVLLPTFAALQVMRTSKPTASLQGHL